MKSNLTFSRWLFSLLLIAFVWSGTAQAQSKIIKPDQDELSAIEETAVVFDQGQLNPNRSLRSLVCPSGNLSEGFEDAVFPPPGWKVINSGDANTWIRYTSSAIAGSASASIAYSSAAHNDWLIAPRVVPQAGNSDFSFWAKNGSSTWTERFNVKLSTTGTDQADFTVTLASNVGPGTVASQYTYDLSAYNGQPVYVAIQAISSNQLRLYVDDFSGPELYGFIPPYYVSATSVDFGVTFDIGSYSMDYEIKNCSAGDLELDFLSSSPEVSITGLPLTVVTGTTGTITVNFNPSASGPYSGNFQLTTNDPENPTLQAGVISTVQHAVVTQSIYENFDSYAGFSVPANWGGNFSTRTTGGLNNSARLTKNLWGTGSSMTGQFYTNFVDMADDGILSFSYRAVNYTSYPNTPTPAASFEFVVWISTDFGISFTPIYVCDATNHSPSNQYAFVEVDLSAYSGETAMFLIDAERFADDFYLDFDDFSVSFVQPGLEFMAPEVLMGERPIAAWMKPAALGIMNNPGKGSFTFGAVDLDNNYDGFLSAVNPALPFVLDEGEFTEEFGIRTNNTAVAPGAFSGSLAFFYEPTSTRAVSVVPFSGTAYTPVNGDVWEKAFTASTVTFPVTVAKGDFRDNYDLPGATDDGWDVVYKIVASANDMLADISLTGTDAKMAVYPADFGGVGGPDTDNALVSATTAVTGIELYQGTYYLVVSTTGANFILNYTPTVMPSPDAVTNLTPIDGALNVINGNNLTWSYGANTMEYRVVLGTTYPPATVVQDWATANTAANGSYTLAGLNPNLQYFWRVDVRNNNGTSSGDVWGFTTTITPPSALDVTVNDPGESATTVSASLTWTGPTNRAFIGYNVYRNSVKLTPTPIDNASFTDLGLARNTTYSYTVKSVYDEGESAASNTVSVTTQGVGTFNGFVYDALTNAPLEGATVKITGSAGDYTVSTTANGAYSTLAYKGTYNFTVSATDYNSQAVSNVTLNHGATVSRNFYLSETPFPVGEVIAFELNDNSTQVSWSGTAPSPIELVKITQNPGTPQNAYYQYFDMGYGVVYDLLAYPDASISSMNFHHASWGTYGTWQYKIHVYNWDTKTLIGTYGPFSTTGNDKWESGVNLGNVSAGGAGLVAIIMEPLGNVFDDAFPNLSSDDDDLNPQGSIFGELNDLAGMATSGIGNFLMELYIYTAQGARASAPRYVDFGKVVNAPNRMNTTAEASKSVINQTSLSITKGEETFTNRTVVGPSYYADATRGIVSYDVWREKAFQPGALVKIGNTFSEDFVDFDWGNMGWGVYRWGVTVNYDAGQVSAITYSNTLDKDMEIAVDVAVALNSSESPGGTSVTFTNTSEPDLELVYNTVLDNSGAFAWDAFRRGVYNIQVMHPGYAVVSETGVEIFDDASFEWLLEELLAAPGNLYVTPTAFATWNLGGGGGGGGSFTPFMESFDGLLNGEIPAGWTRSPDVVRWGAFSSNNAGGTSPEMRFGWSPSITGEFSVMTPSMNTSGQTQLTLSFDNYLWHYSSSYDYSVKVVAIADGVQHIIQAWDPVTANIPKGLLSYDLTAAHGVGASDFKIAWIFDGNTMGTFYWYFDNVMLNGSRAKAGRSFATNKVFLDGQLITETTDNEYQYDVATLTPYETYTAGVAAVYSTGQSPTAEFDFIYVPCGDYDVPTAFAATQVEGTLDIMLEWTNVDAAALDTISAFRIYRNGEEYVELNFEDAAVDTYLDANLDFGIYTYCVTYIYDSGAETCQGLTCSDEVEIDGNAGVDGMVMQAAYLGGDPIEGASVLLVNVDNPATTFEFFTDATGAYEGMIIAGTYDYTVSANGYTSVMLEDVEIVLNATVTNDFELIEFPYPPILVYAEEITDNNVLITWHSPAFAPFEPIFETFDNGIPSSWTIEDGGTTTDTWYMETPAGNPQTTGASLDGTNFAHVDSDEAGSGASLYEILYTPVVNAATVETLYLSFDQYYRHLGSSNGKVEVYDGSNWVTVLNQTATAGAWSNPNHQVLDVSAYANQEFQARFIYTDGTSWSWYWSIDNVAITDAVTRSGAPVLSNTEAPERELFGYEVYRTTCETGALQFLGLTLDTLFNDNTWGAVPSGMYKWGVVALYDEDNVSETIFSNCLDKDMVTSVSVTVTTNSGDSPEGTNVLFTNTSEPDLELTYATQLDETGYFAWDEFRKGTYDISAEKLGFGAIELSDYVIDGPEAFVWLLEELLLPVSDLYVTPTGFATWRAGGVIPFEPFIEDFSGGIDNWTAVPNTGNWQLSQTNLAGGVAPEVRFYWSPNTTNRFYFISPMMSTLTQTEIEMSFDHFINDFGGGYTIQLVSIADGVEYEVMSWPAADAPATNVVTTLTTAHGVGAAEFQIAFVFDGAAWDMNWWNIDNIMLYTPGSREGQGYKVWLDGVYEADTEDTFYQYDVTTLVEGQEYLAEVAALYSNGMSAKMSYLWTYYSCENYPGPDGLEAEVNGQDVTLNWSGTTPPPPPGDSFEDDFEGHADFLIDFAPWTNVDVDGSATYGMTGITWPNAYAAQSFIVFNPSATAPALTGADAHSGNKYAACFASVTAPNNDWLMSPLVPVGAGTTVSFWAKSYTADYGLERFKVGVSTTGLNPSDFTIISPGSFVEAPATAWTEYSYDLSAYAGQDVYVGINCVSNDAFFLMVDDFTVGAAAASFAFNPPSLEIARGTKAIGEVNSSTYGNTASNFDPAMAAHLVDSKAFSGETAMNRAVGVLWGNNWEDPQASTDGIISTYYGGLGAPTYSADDFTVPAGEEWIVSSLWARGFLSAGVPSPQGFGYTIFADANGAPGAVLYEEINAGANNPDLVEIDLDTPITLTEGTYWIAFYAYYQNATGTTQGRWNQYMWNPATTPGNPAMLNDVAGLFGGTGGFVTLGSLGVNFSSLDFAVVGESQDAGGGGGDFDPGLLLGANVYRDGILIAEMVTDDFYVDQGVDYGTYTYCVHYVYESGAESCTESCVEVEIPFPCDPPKELTGVYHWTTEDWGGLIEWNSPQDAVAEWLFYDDGVNVDGIGGPATFTWAVKFDPAQLADFGGASLTKIMIYNRTGATDELRIYEGTNAATLLHTQPLSGLGIEVYEEVTLTSPVLLDVTKQLWIAVATTDGVNYPAGVSNYAGNPNSDLITQDGGVTWEHLNTLGLPYSWNLRGFVTTVAGATAALPMDKPIDQISNSGESFVVTGKPSAQAFFPDETTREGRELESFNVYRSESGNNYELIASVPFEDGVTAYSYFDTEITVSSYYQVTAFYSYTNGTCESVPALSLLNPEDDFVYVIIESTNEFNLNNTRVYPNPANNNVVIESAKMNRVTVMNALGQVVLDRAIEGQTRHDLNTSTYEAGIYLIRIETNEGVVTKRLTIVR